MNTLINLLVLSVCVASAQRCTTVFETERTTEYKTVKERVCETVDV